MAKNEKTNEYSNKKAALFSFSQISDIVSYQTFTFLVFTFYYAVIGINVVLVSVGFVIWSIWNSLNDPILGWLSDRTHTKIGRRIPYMIAAFIPLGVIMILLFTPPAMFGITDELTNFMYFLIIIIVFELFYTMFSLNQTSLFPEIFISAEERTKANNIRQTVAVVALIVAFVLPGLFISDYSDPNSLSQYTTFGILTAIIIIVAAFIFLKFGPKEKAEFKDDYKNAPSFYNSIKYCVKSKSFMWYIPAEVANWFVFGMLPIIVPLYGKFVLGIDDPLMISLLLGFAFISAALFINLLWKPVAQKIGPRKAWLMSMSIWIITLLLLLFIEDFIGGVVIFALVGIGLAGSLYNIDLIVADIIDEDEVNTGSRREAAYYGVNALFLRLSTVFVFLAISMVFTNVGWAVFEPENINDEIILGLKVLIAVFPAIALALGVLAIYKYPLDGEKLQKVKEQLKELHEKKRSQV